MEVDEQMKYTLYVALAVCWEAASMTDGCYCAAVYSLTPPHAAESPTYRAVRPTISCRPQSTRHAAAALVMNGRINITHPLFPSIPVLSTVSLATRGCSSRRQAVVTDLLALVDHLGAFALQLLELLDNAFLAWSFSVAGSAGS